MKNVKKFVAKCNIIIYNDASRLKNKIFKQLRLQISINFHICTLISFITIKRKYI